MYVWYIATYFTVEDILFIVTDVKGFALLLKMIDIEFFWMVKEHLS